MRLLTALAAVTAAACTVYVAHGGQNVSSAVSVAPPSSYTAPEGTRVTSSAGLAAALRRGGTIVLADGTYDARSAVTVPAGARLVAEHVGRAVLHAGLSIGDGPAVVRGLAFSIRNAQRTLDGAAIDIWGAGRNTVVEDVTVDGHHALPYALVVRSPDGFVGRRIVARALTSDGIVVDTYPRHVVFARPPHLADVDIADVSRPVPRSAHGTAESCLWLGVTIVVERARVRDCAWMGVWTGFNSVGSRYAALDIDRAPVGVYVEHYTTSSTFTGLHVGSGVRIGVNCEWADPRYGRRPASVHNVIRDSVFRSYETGVFLDEGTTRTTVESSTFVGQRIAAIIDFRGRNNAYRANDYSGIGGSAVPVSHDHG